MFPQKLSHNYAPFPWWYSTLKINVWLRVGVLAKGATSSMNHKIRKRLSNMRTVGCINSNQIAVVLVVIVFIPITWVEKLMGWHLWWVTWNRIWVVQVWVDGAKMTEKWGQILGKWDFVQVIWVQLNGVLLYVLCSCLFSLPWTNFIWLLWVWLHISK